MKEEALVSDIEIDKLMTMILTIDSPEAVARFMAFYIAIMRS